MYGHTLLLSFGLKDNVTSVITWHKDYLSDERSAAVVFCYVVGLFGQAYRAYTISTSRHFIC